MHELDQKLGELVSALEAGAEAGFTEEHEDRFRALLQALPTDLPPEHRDFVAFIEGDWEQRKNIMMTRGPAADQNPIAPFTDPAAGETSGITQEDRGKLLEFLRTYAGHSPARAARGSGFEKFLERLFGGLAEKFRDLTPDGVAQIIGGYSTVEEGLRPRKAQEQQLLERQGRKLSMRHSGEDIPGHVEHFRDMNGLVHGGIITTQWYTLHCRAFLSGIGNVRTAAGACEQRSLDGELITRWSTAERLQERYNDLTQKAPQDFPLYYLNFSFPYDVLLMAKTGEPVHDSGVPLPQYSSEPRAIWNPLCVPEMSEKSPRMPIISPYLKVFSPSPKVRKTIVTMIGAFRETQKAGPFIRAKWHVRTFS